MRYDLLVIGAGPGGFSAAFRAADLGLSVALVERYPTLGGVCLNVGCIPSKALLHKVGAMREAAHLAAAGIHFAPPSIDIDALRRYRHQVVGPLTGGLAAMAAAREVDVVHGTARFISAHEVLVTRVTATGPNGTADTASAASRTLAFDKVIIACGSRAVKLPGAPDDPRILDSTSALALEDIPKRLLVVGGGIIGLEIATVYAGLGSRVDVVEGTPELMPGTDRDLIKIWDKTNRPLLGDIHLSSRVAGLSAGSDGIRAVLDGLDGKLGPPPYDRVLVSIGRRPDTAALGLEALALAADARGFIPVDSQMRTAVPHVFAIGDVVGQPMLAHKAVHQGHVAAEAAAGQSSHFDAGVVPSVAYTDPEIAWVGVTEVEVLASGRKVTRGVFPWAASGRAIASDAAQGLTRLLFDAEDGRCIGGGIVGGHAGDLIGEVCLAIEMGANATDIGRTIHPHPTFCESVGLAAEAAVGHCTDLMPQPSQTRRCA
jgi:dihydrolipoamide dehydrogenase